MNLQPVNLFRYDSRVTACLCGGSLDEKTGTTKPSSSSLRIGNRITCALGCELSATTANDTPSARTAEPLMAVACAGYERATDFFRRFEALQQRRGGPLKELLSISAFVHPAVGHAFQNCPTPSSRRTD
jgi:hypothetical protein